VGAGRDVVRAIADISLSLFSSRDRQNRLSTLGDFLKRIS
jgi:hypothetical protein